MKETAVFAGPTLSGISENPHGFQILPPAAYGNLRNAVRDGFKRIVLVDACFFHTPAPTHAEILQALSDGIVIIGVASAGALRACELESFGMRGVGAVYAAYRDGAIRDDSEVGVAMSPIDYQPMSIPLVNIRALLRILQVNGMVERTLCALFDAARKIHFLDRSMPALLAAWSKEHATEVPHIRPICTSTSWDIKRRDAVAALANLDEPGGALVDYASELWL